MDHQDTLLLACCSMQERKHMGSMLRDSYYLLEASNSQQMQTLLNQNAAYIAAIVADMEIWEKWMDESRNGSNGQLLQIPVIMIGADDTPELLNRGFALGAADVIPVGYDPDAMLHRIDTIVQLYLHRRHLQVLVDEQARKLRQSNEMMVDVLSSIIEYRSAESGQHILRIRHFTKILLEEVQKSCPEYGLTNEVISIISSAAALHDVGKIAIADAILMKPGKLTDAERQIMQTHAELGSRILIGLEGVGDPEYLRYAHNICRYHHERWDGTGYPMGLSGDQIPICAQVVGLADAYDALTSERVYKKAYPFQVATNMILRGECGAFSPKLLECFKQVYPRYELLARAYADGLTPGTEHFEVRMPEIVKQDGSDSMNLLQGEFQCLLHYINAFVMELDVDGGHYHLRFNPYPELAGIGMAADFADLERIVLERIVAEEDRSRMYRLIREEMGEFLRDGLRRRSFVFRLRGRDGNPEPFQLTLLRVDANLQEKRSLAVICRKMEEVHCSKDTTAASEGFPDCSQDEGYCCLNDRELTLVRSGGDVFSDSGYSDPELKQMFENRLIKLIHPEDRDRVREELRQQFLRSSRAQVRYRILHKDGRIRWIHSQVKLETAGDGREYLHFLPVDITEAYAAFDAIEKKIQRYEIILAQSENALFEWDVVRDTISFSDTWEKIFGLKAIENRVMQHLSHGTLFHPDDMERLMDGIENLRKGSDYEMAELRVATSKGRYLWCRFRASAVRSKDGKLEKICGIIINVDSEKQSSQALQERAERDALTGLLNKYAGRKKAEEYLARFPMGAPCALLMIDLDHFKPINDRFGHLFGDTVLTQVARVLKKLFRNQDIISRVGGDEFTVLMRGVSDPLLLENRCRQMLDVFRNTFGHLNQELPMSCSIGVAISPQHGTSYVELYQRADHALYQAKARGKNGYAFYDMTRTALYANLRTVTDIDSDREPGLAENSLVQYAFRQLYTSSDLDASIKEILDYVGRKMNVSRVYVFENSEDNRYCSNTFEWCNEGILPEIENLQNISYEDDIAGYTDAYDENGIFYCPDIASLPENIYRIVAPQGIKSLLHCAMRDKGVFRGYIGFDECVRKRMWTKEQIDVLTYLSEMLSVFLLKKREQEKALRQAEEFRTILDNQNAWIYIIDPETCELKYLNEKARHLAPNAETGMHCYEVLMGNCRRCEGCPSLDIHTKKVNSAKLRSPKHNLCFLSEATRIRWNGCNACLITCRELPDEAEILE